MKKAPPPPNLPHFEEQKWGRRMLVNTILKRKMREKIEDPKGFHSKSSLFIPKIPQKREPQVDEKTFRVLLPPNP
jgi:hypothetical protein